MKRLLESAVRGYLAHRCATRGAALAFYALFMLVPIPIFAVSAVAALVGGDLARSEVIDVLRALGGEQMAVTVSEALETSVELAAGRAARLFGVASLLFGAAAFFVELQDALNEIWGVPAGGFRLARFVRARLASFAMVVTSGTVLLILTLAGALAWTFGEKLKTQLPSLSPAFGAVGFAISLLVTAALFSLVFRYIPDTKVSFRDVWIGSVVTAALFVAGNELTGLYLRYTSLATAYGAAGSLVLTLIWVYYSSLAFLFGAELTRCLGVRRRLPTTGTGLALF